MDKKDWKGWLQEKALLFFFLCLIVFVFSPNQTVRGAYCGLGFTSYCERP